MSIIAGETLRCVHDDNVQNVVNLEELMMFYSEKMATVTGEFPKVQSSSKCRENQPIWQSVAFSFGKRDLLFSENCHKNIFYDYPK